MGIEILFAFWRVVRTRAGRIYIAVVLILVTSLILLPSLMRNMAKTRRIAAEPVTATAMITSPPYDLLPDSNKRIEVVDYHFTVGRRVYVGSLIHNINPPALERWLKPPVEIWDEAIRTRQVQIEYSRADPSDNFPVAEFDAAFRFVRKVFAVAAAIISAAVIWLLVELLLLIRLRFWKTENPNGSGIYKLDK